tara:strand:- start:6184 stop:6519 length:336 start_codon:yes stop_codon:yes gene_type:complete
MNNIKHHIIIKSLSLLLAVLILAPVVHKFSHLFTHHEDDVCSGLIKKEHLHELNLNCDFYKFKLNTTYTITFFNFNLFSPKEKPLKIVSQYQFLSEYQRLQTSLRGPPALI